MRKYKVLIYCLLIVGCKMKYKEKKHYKTFEFYTQYNQFYIADSQNNNVSDGFWEDDESYSNKIDNIEGIIAVVTASYGNIKGEIALANDFDKNIEGFDFVAESQLEIKSGQLDIRDCPNFSVESSLNIPNGVYNVKVYMYNLDSVIDDQGDDKYTIILSKLGDDSKDTN